MTPNDKSSDVDVRQDNLCDNTGQDLDNSSVTKRVPTLTTFS